MQINALTTNAGGTTTINGDTVTTTGDQSYGDDVVLGTSVVLNGNDLLFGSTVSGPFSLTANTGGTADADHGEGLRNVTRFSGDVKISRNAGSTN